MRSPFFRKFGTATASMSALCGTLCDERPHPSWWDLKKHNSQFKHHSLLELMYDYLHYQIAIAFVLDLLIGDPRRLPHPIRMLGRAIDVLEKLLRNLFTSGRLAGVFLTGIIVIGTYLLTFEIICIFSYLGKAWEIAAGAIIVFFSLSIRDLLTESKGILKLLKSGNIAKARERLSKIVGRDTENLDEREITRGCIETTAENSVDGIIAPLFYAFIGGPPLAMAYKAINTLDSMVGYKNERYLKFGWASARLDDLANYVPARLASVILIVSSFICGADYKNALKTAIKDGQKHPSPNSGVPEATIAGALRIRLGGPCTYNGITSNKPFIGRPLKEIGPDDIKDTIRIVLVASILTISFGITIFLALKSIATLI